VNKVICDWHHTLLTSLVPLITPQQLQYDICIRLERQYNDNDNYISLMYEPSHA